VDKEFYDQVIERMDEDMLRKVAFYAGSRPVNFNTALTRLQQQPVEEMYRAGLTNRQIADQSDIDMRQVQRLTKPLREKKNKATLS